MLFAGGVLSPGSGFFRTLFFLKRNFAPDLEELGVLDFKGGIAAVAMPAGFSPAHRAGKMPALRDAGATEMRALQGAGARRVCVRGRSPREPLCRQCAGVRFRAYPTVVFLWRVRVPLSPCRS